MITINYTSKVFDPLVINGIKYNHVISLSPNEDQDVFEQKVKEADQLVETLSDSIKIDSDSYAFVYEPDATRFKVTLR